MKPFSLARTAFVYRVVRLTAACGVVAWTVDHGSLSAQAAIARVDSSNASRLVITGAEPPHAYDALPDVSRTHYASTSTLVEYKWGTGPILRNDPEHRSVVCGTAAWKPNRRSRLDISPLFSVTAAASARAALPSLSILFDSGGESQQADTPAFSRDR